MSEFERSEWNEAERCQDYRDTADHYVVERQTLLAILSSFYRRFVGVDQGKRVMDLGCGDGIIGETLHATDSSMELIAVDASPDMLAAARQRLVARPQTQFYQRTFAEIIAGDQTWTTLDLIASSFAIHHLDNPEKLALFARLHEMLRPNGCFLNIDILLPDDGADEEWYYELWQEWIAARQRRLGLADDFTSVSAEARKNPDNRYESLTAQLAMLRQAGFTEVACHYRYGLFGIYSGRKAPRSG